MALVPKKLQKNQREIKRINEEIKEDYAFAVKKSVVDFVLKEPEIDEDERFLGKSNRFYFRGTVSQNPKQLALTKFLKFKFCLMKPLLI
jgi:hypothetical protein